MSSPPNPNAPSKPSNRTAPIETRVAAVSTLLAESMASERRGVFPAPSQKDRQHKEMWAAKRAQKKAKKRTASESAAAVVVSGTRRLVQPAKREKGERLRDNVALRRWKETAYEEMPVTTPVILVDCSFSGVMTYKELRSLRSQISHFYGTQRRLRPLDGGIEDGSRDVYPFFALVGVTDVFYSFLSEMAGVTAWKLPVFSTPLEDLFQKGTEAATVTDLNAVTRREGSVSVFKRLTQSTSQLVYLSPDGPTSTATSAGPLHLDVSGASVFVIGGIVDHNRLSLASFTRATLLQETLQEPVKVTIRHLPLTEALAGTKVAQSLNVNHVAELIAKLAVEIHSATSTPSSPSSSFASSLASPSLESLQKVYRSVIPVRSTAREVTAKSIRRQRAKEKREQEDADQEKQPKRWNPNCWCGILR